MQVDDFGSVSRSELVTKRKPNTHAHRQHFDFDQFDSEQALGVYYIWYLRRNRKTNNGGWFQTAILPYQLLELQSDWSEQGGEEPLLPDWHPWDPQTQGSGWPPYVHPSQSGFDLN